MVELTIDFETHSEADLTKVGAAIYAEDPSTDIMCIAFALAEQPLVYLIEGAPDVRCYGVSHNLNWRQLYNCALDPTIIFVAHNAYFEYMIWHEIMVKRYGFPPIPLTRWKCTMAKAYASSLPGSLEGAAAALNLNIQKDIHAKAILMKLCKPRREGGFWTPATAPEDFQVLYAYCINDVNAERCLNRALRDLSPEEHETWLIDMRINIEGVHLDIPAIERAILIANEHKAVLHENFRTATNDAVGSPTQREKLRVWANANGLALADTQKSTITKVLGNSGVQENVARALTIALEANKASLAKYKAMMQRSKNGVLREILQYHGAHTGRWAGRGVQLQNLARELAGQSATTVIQMLMLLPYAMFCLFYADVSGALSHSIRAMIIAPAGTRFLIGDFAQIEARVLAWLAGQGEKLDLFRSGLDLYCKIAGDIYGYEVTKKMPERQVGKVADLALGFGGGISAFANMAKAYAVNLLAVAEGIWNSATEQERVSAEWSYQNYLQRAEDPVSPEVGMVADIIKQRWRAANPKIVQFWSYLERTAIEAVQTGQPVRCGMVTWFMHGVFLYCRLPSGRAMAYPFPRLKTNSRGNTELHYFGKVPNTSHWGWIGTYGGKLCENVVQAVARDLLRDAMRRMELIYPVKLHTHDELVSAVASDRGSVLEYNNLMAKNPSWAEDLPIVVDAWESVRYGKAA